MSAENKGERVQKVLSRAGVASRRRAEELIRQGAVTINGEPAVLGDRVDPERDSIRVEGRPIRLPKGERHLLLNKPRGYLSTLSDPEGRSTVLDLIPPHLRKALFPVGRLDYQTEGLLLLTTDGALAQRVAHPRYGCLKVYVVKVKGEPDAMTIEKLESGVFLEGRRTAPCSIRAQRARRGARVGVSNSWWRVELSEGRTRQIREMFHRVGHSVQRLRRVAIGPLTDRDLPTGACRELTSAELALLRKTTRGKGGPTTTTQGAARRPRRQRGGS